MRFGDRGEGKSTPAEVSYGGATRATGVRATERMPALVSHTRFGSAALAGTVLHCRVYHGPDTLRLHADAPADLAALMEEDDGGYTGNAVLRCEVRGLVHVDLQDPDGWAVCLDERPEGGDDPGAGSAPRREEVHHHRHGGFLEQALQLPARDDGKLERVRARRAGYRRFLGRTG